MQKNYRGPKDSNVQPLAFKATLITAKWFPIFLIYLWQTSFFVTTNFEGMYQTKKIDFNSRLII